MQTRRQAKYPQCTNVKMQIGVNACIHAFVDASPVSPRPFHPFRYYLHWHYGHMSMWTSITSYLRATSNPFQHRSSVKLGVSGRSVMFDGHGSQRVPRCFPQISFNVAFLCVRKLRRCVHLAPRLFSCSNWRRRRERGWQRHRRPCWRQKNHPSNQHPISEKRWRWA